MGIYTICTVTQISHFLDSIRNSMELRFIIIHTEPQGEYSVSNRARIVRPIIVFKKIYIPRVRKHLIDHGDNTLQNLSSERPKDDTIILNRKCNEASAITD